jgi:Zn-dependent protease
MNFILFLLCALPAHPNIGLIEPITRAGLSEERLHLFLGCMAWLQMLSVLFNLVPVPPLDGYQMAEQFLPDETRDKIRQSGQILFFIYFAILWQVPGAFQYFHNGVENTLQALGFDELSIAWLGSSYNRVLYGKM